MLRRSSAVGTSTVWSVAFEEWVPGQRVIMPGLEWETRFLRTVERIREGKLGSPLAAREFTAEPTPVTSLDAVAAYVQALTREAGDIAAEAKRLAHERTRASTQASHHG